MVKNITVGISDELSDRMEQLKEVNWSAVTRECIEQYIKQRTSGGLEQAVSKVKAMRGDEFKKGYDFVTQNHTDLGLAALEEIAYPGKEDHQELLFTLITDKLGEELFNFNLDGDGNYIEHSARYRVSSNFQKGMQEAAKELLERSE